jgi:hypothetical protein
MPLKLERRGGKCRNFISHFFSINSYFISLLQYKTYTYLKHKQGIMIYLYRIVLYKTVYVHTVCKL